MGNLNKKVYFASPFFTPEQVEREERLKTKLRDMGFEVFSPKEMCHLHATATQEERDKVFNDNVEGIMESDIVFAVTDGKDMGTIWEAGYACGLRAKGDDKKLIYYCETLNGGNFNLMLAKSGDIIFTNYEELNNLPVILNEGGRNTYEGLIE